MDAKGIYEEAKEIVGSVLGLQTDGIRNYELAITAAANIVLECRKMESSEKAIEGKSGTWPKGRVIPACEYDSPGPNIYHVTDNIILYRDEKDGLWVSLWYDDEGREAELKRIAGHGYRLICVRRQEHGDRDYIAPTELL